MAEPVDDIFEFEGHTIKRSGKFFRCPFNCGDPRFPRPKWKTLRGIKGHLDSCYNRPSAIAKREEAKQAL